MFVLRVFPAGLCFARVSLVFVQCVFPSCYSRAIRVFGMTLALQSTTQFCTVLPRLGVLVFPRVTFSRVSRVSTASCLHSCFPRVCVFRVFRVFAMGSCFPRVYLVITSPRYNEVLVITSGLLSF